MPLQIRYQLDGYQVFFTSVGRGKGLATYVKEGLQVQSHSNLTEENIALAKTSFNQLDVINIYRSKDEPLSRTADLLQNVINPEKDTLIVGDFNVCASKTNALSSSLEMAGFRQHVNVPTHIKGGTFNTKVV